MVNSRRIEDLHPTLVRGACELKNRLSAINFDMLITCTYRDSEAQNALFAQGRTKPGNVVTKAKAGQSMHNYRLAFDICKNIKGKEYNDPLFFQKAGEIWRAMGGVWGGDWKNFPDRPHFEYTGGLTLKDLQAGKTLPQNANMQWEKISNTTISNNTTSNTTTSNTTTVSESERTLLYKLVHHEARGEDEKGKMLVVYVVFNRVLSKGKGFPNSIYDVIYQKGAFSPVKRDDFMQTVPTTNVVQAVDKAINTKDNISCGALYFAGHSEITVPGSFFANAVADGRIAVAFKHGGHTFLK